MRGVPWVRFVVFVLAFAPALAHAQATITGVVKDTSGAVLPGVTVEAASPALIEKVRSAVTDGSGQYRIVDLRPGTYTRHLHADRIQHRQARRHRADRDVHRARSTPTCGSARSRKRSPSPANRRSSTCRASRRQTTVSGDVIAAIPTSRVVRRALPARFRRVLDPAPVRADVQVTPGLSVFGGPGGRGTEGRLQVDGLSTGAPLNGGGVSGYVADIANAQEVVVHHVGRSRRSRSRRTDDEHRAEDRRQHRQGHDLRGRRERRHGRQQLHRRTAGRRPPHAGRAAQVVGLQSAASAARSRRTACGTS